MIRVTWRSLFVVLLILSTCSKGSAADQRFSLDALSSEKVTELFKRYISEAGKQPVVSAAAKVCDLSTVQFHLDAAVPSLVVSYVPIAPDPAPLVTLVREFLSRFLLSGRDYGRLIPNLRFSPTRAVPARSPFEVPEGLSMSPPALEDTLGFPPGPCVNFTPAHCWELATAAYRQGLFSDAIVLLNHAVMTEPAAPFFYLKAVCELATGRCDDALVSARRMVEADSAGHAAGLARAREMFNGPLAVKVSQLADVLKQEPLTR